MNKLINPVIVFLLLLPFTASAEEKLSPPGSNIISSPRTLNMTVPMAETPTTGNQAGCAASQARLDGNDLPYGAGYEARQRGDGRGAGRGMGRGMGRGR